MTRDLDVLRERHEEWQERLSRAEAAMRAAERAYYDHVPRDPGILSGVNAAWGKRRDALGDRASEAYREWERVRAKARMAESRYYGALRDAETSAAVVIADIRPGDLIRTTSWYRVRRVNPKSITTEPAFPGADALRWAHHQIKEVRHQ